jgi:hypothetical protein
LECFTGRGFLAITGTNMYFTHHYIIDWDKVKTTEDLIVILKEINLSFENPSKEMKKLCVFVKKSETGFTCD